MPNLVTPSPWRTKKSWDGKRWNLPRKDSGKSTLTAVMSTASTLGVEVKALRTRHTSARTALPSSCGAKLKNKSPATRWMSLTAAAWLLDNNWRSNSLPPPRKFRIRHQWKLHRARGFGVSFTGHPSSILTAPSAILLLLRQGMKQHRDEGNTLTVNSRSWINDSGNRKMIRNTQLLSNGIWSPSSRRPLRNHSIFHTYTHYIKFKLKLNYANVHSKFQDNTISISKIFILWIF